MLKKISLFCMFVCIYFGIQLIITNLSIANDDIFDESTPSSGTNEPEELTIILSKIKLYEHSNNVNEALKQYDSLITSFPSKRHFQSYGVFCAKNKLFDKAEKMFYNTIVNIELEYPELEMFFYRYQMFESLINMYTKLKDKTKDIELYKYYDKQLIKIFQINNKYQEIITLCSNSILKSPKIADYYISTLIKLASDNTYKDFLAGKKLDNIIIISINKLISDSKSNSPLLVRLYMALGDIYFNNEDIKKSIENYIYTIQTSATFSEYEFYAIYNRFSNYEDHIQKIKLLDAYLEKQFEGSDLKVNKLAKIKIMYLKVSILSKLKRIKESKDILINLLSELAKPDFKNNALLDKTLLMLSECYYEDGQFDNALACLKKIKSSKNLQIQIAIAKCHIGKQNYSSANDILMVLTNTPQTYYYLAIATLLQGDIEKALKYFERLTLEFSYSEFTFDALNKMRIIQLIKKEKEACDLYIDFEKSLQSKQWKLLFSKSAKYLFDCYIKELQVYFKMSFAEILTLYSEYSKVEKIYQQVISDNISSFSVQEAMFKLGSLYITKLDKVEEGKNILLNILKENPNTVFRLKIQEALKGLIKKK